MCICLHLYIHMYVPIAETQDIERKSGQNERRQTDGCGSPWRHQQHTFNNSKTK